MQIGNAGIAIWLFGVGVADIDKRCQHIRHVHLIAISIRAGRFLHRLLLRLSARIANSRITEAQRLWFKNTADGFVVRERELVPFVFLSFVVMHLHLIVVLHLHLHVANHLAHLYLVLQRHVLTLQVAYQVAKRLLGSIHVQRNRVLDVLALGHLHRAILERHTVGYHAHWLVLQFHRTHVGLWHLHVLHHVAVALQRNRHRQRKHLRVVEQRVALLYRE